MLDRCNTLFSLQSVSSLTGSKEMSSLSKKPVQCTVKLVSSASQMAKLLEGDLSMKITATIAGILHVNSRKSRGFWIPHVNRKEGACIGPFLSKVKHISLSLVLGRGRSGYWEGKHQFYSPFLQEPQVEVVIMSTEAGGVVQRWSAYGKCREGWDRQSAPAPSFGDVGSLLLDSVTCGFSWHPGKENLALQVTSTRNTYTHSYLGCGQGSKHIPLCSWPSQAVWAETASLKPDLSFVINSFFYTLNTGSLLHAG